MSLDPLESKEQREKFQQSRDPDVAAIERLVRELVVPLSLCHLPVITSVR